EQLATRRMMARLGDGGRGGSALVQLGERAGANRLGKADPETLVLLDQLGWRSRRRRMLFLCIQAGLPLGLTLIATLLQMGLAVRCLVPKRGRAGRVRRRRARLRQGASLMMAMLRMVFDVGRTVEQALRVVASDGERILPELSRELCLVLNRVDAGLELGQE